MRDRFSAALKAANHAVASAWALLVAIAASALTWMLVLGAAGFVLIVAGVYILAGIGWAFIAGGVACLVLAYFVHRGVTDGN